MNIKIFSFMHKINTNEKLYKLFTLNPYNKKKVEMKNSSEELWTHTNK